MSKPINRRNLVGGVAAASMVGALATRRPYKAAAQVSGDLRYMMWDANQLPAYEAALAKFKEHQPDVNVQVEQLGWADYWTAVQVGMISGDAPDVFVNHIQMYPEFASRNQLVDIQPMVERDGLDTSIYQGELTEVWQRDGVRYGLPKDWDTIALVYNKEMLDEAGIDPTIFDTWTWNLDDGGEFEETVKKLTLDANGNDATSADFDPQNVERYGIAMPLVDSAGQGNWSVFVNSTGWQAIEAPWTPPFKFDDERFINTFQWLADLKTEKRISVPEDQIGSLGIESLLAARTSAMVFIGSWLIGWLDDNLDFEFGFGHLPAGPEGRKSMINGLADSIWVGSENQDAAWELVKFLASEEAQVIVGEHGVVFPAITAGADAAQAAYEERGLDVSPFVEQANEENGTFLYPIADHASEYIAIIEPALESVALGQARAEEVIPEMNAEINDLFE